MFYQASIHSQHIIFRNVKLQHFFIKLNLQTEKRAYNSNVQGFDQKISVKFKICPKTSKKRECMALFMLKNCSFNIPITSHDGWGCTTTSKWPIVPHPLP